MTSKQWIQEGSFYILALGFILWITLFGGDEVLRHLLGVKP